MNFVATSVFETVNWKLGSAAVVLHVLAIRSIASHARTALDTP
jgi:hypothetical protein